MSEKDLLKENIKRENRLNKIILDLTKIEENDDRLIEILKGLNIGDKRIYNNELETFVKNSAELKEEERKEFLELVDESTQIYDEIEKEVTEKVGIDVEKTTKNNNKHYTKNKDFEDYQENFVKMSLISSLNSISTSNRIIQQELSILKITPQNMKKASFLLDKAEKESIDWLKYLVQEKKNGNFVLLEDEILDLYDETIEETKKTLKMVESTKEKTSETKEKDKEDVQKKDEHSKLETDENENER